MLFFSNLPRNEMVRKNKENWETFSPSSFDPNVFIMPIRFITHSLKCVLVIHYYKSSELFVMIQNIMTYYYI